MLRLDITNVKAILQKIPGLKCHVHKEAGKSPMVAIVYPGEKPLNVMFYGYATLALRCTTCLVVSRPL